MFSITGITGNVGGNVAYHLLAAGRPIRAVVRDGRKGDAWAERGCEVAIADITDAARRGACVGIQRGGGRLCACSAELRSGVGFS
jgi:NAD(P)H dehydrogenase (quinone)